MSWSRRDSASSVHTTSSHQQNADEGAPGQPLLNNPRHTQTASRYGAIDAHDASGDRTPRASRRSSPEVWRRDSQLNQVPEEETGAGEGADEDDEDDLEAIEWSLEQQGLYAGSYRWVVALYTFVPLSSLLLLAFLAYCPYLFWNLPTTPPEPHPPYFPAPLPYVLAASGMWSLAYLLRTPVFAAVSAALGGAPPVLATLAFHALHVLLYNALRLAPLALLRIRGGMAHDRASWRDPAFARVWWVALGWAATDVAVGIAQSYAQLALYRAVMVPPERVQQVLAHSAGAGASMTSLLAADLEEALPLSPRSDTPKAGSVPTTLDDAIRAAVDQDLEQLVNLKDREDVEEIYGLPPIKIPVFVSCLQRIDSILLSTGITLTLSASYLNSALSLPISTNALTHPPTSNRPFHIAFPCIVLLNLFLNLIYTPLVLPRIGVHTTAYIGFLLGLGTFFTGLGLWGALA
ncbi:hypothetical protein PsYK624_050770 [Phanerochaete sordida]|uniref:Uncharacterized protein n=1 Tax=Phanerochaete sordida TaxID=48140 RepID=A0A9P3G656_9APHY|nr:hypothetical protein PsYK624_050770 [Phanerochaete sordida]